MSPPPIPELRETPAPLEYANPTPSAVAAGPDKVLQMAKASWVAVLVAWLLSFLTRENIQGSFAGAMFMAAVQLVMIVGGLAFGCIAIVRRRRSPTPGSVITHGVVGIVVAGLTIALNIVAIFVFMRLR